MQCARAARTAGRNELPHGGAAAMVNDTTPMKRCTKCGEEKPATSGYFQRDRRTPDGLRFRCKRCENLTDKAIAPKLSIADGMKRCTKCGEIKPAKPEYFRRDKTRKDGLYPQCRKCESSYTSPIVAHPNERKRCTKCGEEKPATAEYFDRDKGCQLGLTACCKDCKRQYRESIQDKLIEYRRAYREANHDTILLKDKQRNQHRSAYLRDKHNQSYQAHRDEILKRNRAYNRNNPHIARNIHARRRARKRSLPDTITTKDWQHALDYFNHRCAVCGCLPDGKNRIIAYEHWIALADPRLDNPGTVAMNILPICHSKTNDTGGCNNSKQHKDPVRWLLERYGETKADEILKRIQAYFDSL